jgi:hypothetical protein
MIEAISSTNLLEIGGNALPGSVSHPIGALTDTISQVSPTLGMKLGKRFKMSAQTSLP